MVKNTDEVLFRMSKVMPVSMIIARLDDGNILYMNKDFCRTFRLTKSAGIKAWDYFCDTNDYERYRAALRRARNIRNFQAQVKREDGTIIWAVSSAHRLTFQGCRCLFSVVHVLNNPGGQVENTASHIDEPVREPMLQNNELVVDLRRQRVFVGEHEIDLTSTEYRLLTRLAQDAGSIVAQDQLLQDVWGYGYAVDRELVRISVCRIRRKLRDYAETPRYLITKPGIGYMLASCQIIK